MVIAGPSGPRAKQRLRPCVSLNGSSHRTGKERAGPHSSIGCHKRYRRGPYLNNLTQRGHRASKPHTCLMLGFGRFMAPARLCSTFDAVDHRRRRPTRLGTCVAHFRLFMRERSDERMADRSERLRSGHWIRRGAHGRCVHPHPAAYTGGMASGCGSNANPASGSHPTATSPRLISCG